MYYTHSNPTHLLQLVLRPAQEITAHFDIYCTRLVGSLTPKKNLDACLDGLLTAFHGHLVAAACLELGIKSADDFPLDSTGAQVKVNLSDVASAIVDKWTVVPEAIIGQPLLNDSSDGVNNYAHVLCHFASLVSEFYDGWREGDGLRMLRCWKILMLHFFANRNTKYALESLRLQFQLAS